MRFQYGYEENISSNQLTIVIVDNKLVEKEPEFPINNKIPEWKITLEKGYYYCVYVMLRFKKEVGVEKKEEQAEVDPYPYK